jgi:hypothetical protein
VQGTTIIDTTEPEVDVIYEELRRWAIAEILEIIKEDLELPLTDESGVMRSQTR